MVLDFYIIIYYNYEQIPLYKIIYLDYYIETIKRVYKGGVKMNAKYFYNQMLNYEEESHKSGKYCDALSNGAVCIHQKGNKSTYYTIFRDGSIHITTKCDLQNCDRIKNINDLEGDDFEIFNPVQITKSGYIILSDSTSVKQVKEIISSLFYHIKRFNDEYSPYTKSPFIIDPSTWKNGLTDSFTYTVRDITGDTKVNICTIKSLCIENIGRRHYGIKCIPFIKNIKNEKAFYVKFINHTFTDTNTNDRHILDTLMSYMGEIGVECKWRECNINTSIYY